MKLSKYLYKKKAILGFFIIQEINHEALQVSVLKKTQSRVLSLFQIFFSIFQIH